MNEVIKYLQDSYICHQTDENTFVVELPIIYQNTDEKICVAVKLSEEEIVLSDAGEFVNYVYRYYENFDFTDEKIQTILQKYDAKYEDGKILIRALLGDIQFAISNFINLACILLYVAE